MFKYAKLNTSGPVVLGIGSLKNALLHNAFNNGVCVGGGTWGGSSIEIPVMGSDPTVYTDGYLEDGDIPTFRILDMSSGAVYDAVLDGAQGAFGDCSGYPGTAPYADCSTFPSFTNFGTYWDLGTVDAIQHCNAQVGGHA